jgi:hypothetical protein
VTDELARVIEFNDQVRRLRAIIDSARPHVGELVTQVVTTTFDRRSRPTTCAAGASRSTPTSRATPDLPTRPMCRLKLASVRAFGAELIVKLRGMPAQSPLSRVVAEIIDAWAVRKGIVYAARGQRRRSSSNRRPADQLPALGESTSWPST